MYEGISEENKRQRCKKEQRSKAELNLRDLDCTKICIVQRNKFRGFGELYIKEQIGRVKFDAKLMDY
jgi:hypothetical protein